MSPSESLAVSAADVRAMIVQMAAQGTESIEQIETVVDSLGSTHKQTQRRAVDALCTLHQRGVDVRALLSRLLADPQPLRRWGAAFTLARCGGVPSEAVPVLLEFLGSTDGDVRWAAAEILTHVPADCSLNDALLDLLRGGNPAQRKMAAYCLRDRLAASEAVDSALLKALYDDEVSVRLAAVSALARVAVDRSRAAHTLVAALDDSDPRMGRAAAAALGELGALEEPVVAALREVARTGDASRRRAAERSLHRLGV